MYSDLECTVALTNKLPTDSAWTRVNWLPKIARIGIIFEQTE